MKYELYYPGESMPEICDTATRPLPEKDRQYRSSKRKESFVLSYIDDSKIPCKVYFCNNWNKR
ncbi:hypothetical protein HN832_02380 [archaeon]|jgi:hypothetical protein|nr:hypothetical protein [archaeon]MBT4373201.1 hypothetical protein [archaeon]MBT4531546.1 hypothetical protein [archaeon]MBT7001276.1 hypothetical protein [archaeon]MBT7282238.1 hypothetical protein [archaeon]